MRIGYNEVSISDSDAIKDVLRSNMDKVCCPGYDGVLRARIAPARYC